MAKWPSASAATFAGSLAPPEASPDTGGEEDRDARGTDTPDMHEQEDVSIPGRLPHRSGNDDIPCSQLPFHNLSDEGEKRSFRVLTDALAAGQILVARLYRPDDSFDSEAAFRILDV